MPQHPGASGVRINVTTKIPRPLATPQVREILALLSAWRVHSPSPDDIVTALELPDRNQITFWDAMILASATSLGCSCVWSEDLKAGQSYGGVDVHNPFV